MMRISSNYAYHYCYLPTGRIWTGTHSYRGRLEHCVMTSSGPVYVWAL